MHAYHTYMLTKKREGRKTIPNVPNVPQQSSIICYVSEVRDYFGSWQQEAGMCSMTEYRT